MRPVPLFAALFCTTVLLTACGGGGPSATAEGDVGGGGTTGSTAGGSTTGGDTGGSTAGGDTTGGATTGGSTTGGDTGGTTTGGTTTGGSTAGGDTTGGTTTGGNSTGGDTAGGATTGGSTTGGDTTGGTTTGGSTTGGSTTGGDTTGGTTTGGTTTGGDPGTPPSYDWSALGATLDGYVSSGQIQGYSFALDVGGETVYTRGGGNLPANAIIPIASAAKAPSAAIILSLVDDGLLDLDTPVAQYFGATFDWPADKAAITLRMLLNHTSGLPFSSPCLDDDSTTLEACAQEIAHTDLNFRPGAFFGYSGAGYQLAGYLATVVSGKSWGTLVDERLATPLHMRYFSYGTSDNPRIAGGLITCAADYLKFTQLYLDGGGAAVSAAQTALVQDDQAAGLPVYYKPVPASSGLNGYSFGWWIADPGNHPGSAGPELGDPGLFGTTPWLDFDQRYTAIILITSSTDTGIAMWNDARRDILAQLTSP
ncbi:serine hydrolase domain-containing protein [Solimonas terrae]|uniref:Beta-lactamase family protein n=1 Tax=Solimonas terrae TaxID=1396819 RepID=A0A6M2BSY3_9GAMM|nr:serine hydrolase domain-containing protein [Solimonas terrae]NGY05716.1 beta-lactamase family protein [Solimonas terrae]